MKKITFFQAVLMSIISSTATAGTMGKAAANEYTWFGSLNIGGAWARSGEGQTFYLSPDIIKTYTIDKSTNGFVSGEVSLGLQKQLSSHWIGQLGLAVAQTGNVKLQGHIYDDADSQFDNYTYSYKIWNRRFTINGKLLFEKENYWLIPWVGAGVGVGFNYAHRFGNTPLIFEAVTNPNFGPNTKTAVNYSFSAGFLKAVSDHWNLGLGYEYVNWGKAQLDRAPEQTLNSGLVVNNINTHGVNFNITYLC